jgi:exopolysaccharide biosynthesis polyprenyl glycosylphosphotransferase
MQRRDSLDVVSGILAMAGDAAGVFGGFALAVWVRFDSGWLTLPKGRPPNLYPAYLAASAVAVVLFLFVFRALDLYVRPQTGSFPTKIPRIVRGCLLGVLLAMVIAFGLQNEVEFSRLAIGISFFLATFFVLLERYILFRVEWNVARHSPKTNRVLILGTDAVAAHVRHTLAREPRLRSELAGFLRTDALEPDPGIPREQIAGGIEDLARVLEQSRVDQVILTDGKLPQDSLMAVMLLCEKSLATFNMVPDLFRIMTRSMDVQSLDDIPLLGLAPWPLDHFWNRVLKRAEDIAGAAVGLLVSAPVIAVAALLIKRTSPGPAFYRQERCGEKGRTFSLYKLRTMRPDAEAKTGPVFARSDDDRRTPVGAFLRRYNLDELPQFWNVLRGDMSLVGPRPERPVFVAQFKEGVSRYMWRHVSKPGLTGWAQVNGLRGNTSIEERIRYDLFYLENWSPAFDFKILAKTLFARENAY